MSAVIADWTGVTWRKSTRSNGSGDCVSWSFLPDGSVAVRDDKDPDGPKLIFTPSEWTAFVESAKAGEADHPGLTVSDAEGYTAAVNGLAAARD